jgi:hypothetical protein
VQVTTAIMSRTGTRDASGHNGSLEVTMTNGVTRGPWR